MSLEEDVASILERVQAMEQALTALAERRDQPERVTYTVHEAAHALGVSESTVKRWLLDGTLPHVQHGIAKKLIPVRAVRALGDTA